MSNQTYTIHGTAHGRYTITLADGRPGRLAVVDENGAVVSYDNEVARACWGVAQESLELLWKGQGHLRAVPRPPERAKEIAA